MKIFPVALFGLLFLVLPAYAGDGAGGASIGLSAQLLCSTVTVAQSQIGLLFGLLVSVFGLWKIIKDANVKGGAILIIAGVLVTVMPRLSASFLEGVSKVLNETGLTDYTITDTMNYALNNVGNCANIPVDFSSYDVLAEGSYGPGGAGASGRPDLKGAENARKYGGSGLTDPNAKTGQPGCTHIVDKGQTGSPYGPRARPKTATGYGSSNHPGVDIRCNQRVGDKVFSAGGGKVVQADWAGGYGRQVVIDHGNGKTTSYAHLNAFNVGRGQEVQSGAVIGFCGTSGNSSGPHVHFEMKVNGGRVDPVANGCGAGGGGGSAAP